MATLLIAVFTLLSHHGTSSSNTNRQKGLHNNNNPQQQQQQPSKPSLRDFDFDRVGVIQESSSQTDDGVDERAKHDNTNNDNKENNNKQQQQPAEDFDDDLVLDDDDTYDNPNYDDDMAWQWSDIDAFERDADMLDAQTTLDGAVDGFETAMAEQLLVWQPDIDSAVETTMKEATKELQELNNNNGKAVKGNVKLTDDDLKKLQTKTEAKLRDRLNAEIQAQSNDILEDLTFQMEAAVDINEEYEEEGEGDPIDLDAEEEELTMQGIVAVDNIVEDILKTNMPKMLMEATKGQLEQLLKEKFGKDRKFEVDFNTKEWKITGWHENLPPKPEPEKKTGDEDDTKKDDKKDDETKPEESKKDEPKATTSDDKSKESEKKEKDDKPKSKDKSKDEEVTEGK